MKTKVNFFKNKSGKIVGVKINEQILKKDLIKFFIQPEISKALSEQKKEIVEMIDKFQKKYKDMQISVNYHNDFNELLKKIMKL